MDGIVAGSANTGIGNYVSDTLHVTGRVTLTGTSSLVPYVVSTNTTGNSVYYGPMSFSLTPKTGGVMHTRSLYNVFVVDIRDGSIVLDGKRVVARSPEEARMKIWKGLTTTAELEDLDILVSLIGAIREAPSQE